MLSVSTKRHEIGSVHYLSIGYMVASTPSDMGKDWNEDILV